ncbi:mfs monocarboxylate [Moniliophthora roreri MCA 2997]|uniref:Mfs monocarboxylate n=1 Tax=Moniliophthora roreri (strain MCA 2997) TaxID=1381753 RepID=V2X2F6_MONRO|nr:mfs monocarboxylate [Moniliophthora roreri MCA 2997]
MDEPIELAGQPQNDSNFEEPILRVNESSLPPVDGGPHAWLFLVSAFVIEAIVWGFPSSFGVFLEAYLADPTYRNQKNASSLLPLIGPLSSGIIYCSGPIIGAFMARYPYYRRWMMRLGAALCWASLFGASYTSNVRALVFLQGALYAVGGVILYCPCISYMSEWFVKRRGFATGVIFAGTAVGGFVLPLTVPLLIQSHGSAKALRYLSIIVAASLIPTLPFCKGRVPELRVRVRAPEPRGSVSGQWWRRGTFWIVVAANTMQGFGYFVPIVWLPTFASALHISTTKASVTLALLNGASVLGGISMGYLSDSFSPWVLAVSTLTFTSLATFILWGILSSSFGGLVSFGIVYGVFAGGWSSLWTGFIRLLSEDPALATTIFGYMGLSRGLGNIFSTPISTALSASSYSNNATSAVAGSHNGYTIADGKYEKMIVYVGTCFAGAALVSLIGWVGDGMKRRQNEETELEG